MRKQRIATRIGKISCVTAAAMSCVGLVGCGTKARDIMKPLENGSYDEAVSVYNEAKLSDKEKASLEKQLHEKLSKTVEDYAADILTYSDAQNIISSISAMNISGLNSDLATSAGSIASLYTSKESYNKGLNFLQQKEYDNAINCFKSVIKDDVNYESATAKIEEAKNLAYNSLKENMVNTVDSYIKSGDYASALSVIEAFNGDEKYQIEDSELDKLYDGYVSEYKKLILDKAGKSLENKEYLTALKILDDAQLVVDCTEFSDLREKIMAEKPVYLCDLKYQTSSRFEVKNDGDPLTDTIGNSYTANNNLYELSSYLDSWSNGDVGSVEYYVGYAYNKLHGTVAVDDTSNDVSGVLTVYGDDVVLYTLNLDRKTVPTEIDIDISNVNYLRITLSANTEGTLTAIMSDFILGK
ncbi:MAG: NPCBM/NEW2 domain-containing protein [Butyrivibrio sp.]